MSSLRKSRADLGEKLFPKHFFDLWSKIFQNNFFVPLSRFILTIENEKIVINLSTKFRTSHKINVTQIN